MPNLTFHGEKKKNLQNECNTPVTVTIQSVSHQTMTSDAEIKLCSGLDVTRYSEIAGSEGLAREKDVGHARQTVKPASQPPPEVFS